MSTHVPRSGGSCPLTRGSSSINSWVLVLIFPDGHLLRAHPNIPSCLFLVYFFHSYKVSKIITFKFFVYFLFISFIDIKASEIITFKFLFTPLVAEHTHTFSHISISTSFSLPQYSWENIPSAHHFSPHCTKEAMHATNRPFSVLLLPIEASM